MEIESNSNLTILLNSTPIPVTSRLLSLSFFKNLSEMFPNQPIPIENKRITPSLLDKILNFLEIHNFAPPQIQKPVTSDDLRKNICEKNFSFIKDFDFNSDEFLDLLETSMYFQIQELTDLCLVRVATEFHSEKNQEAYEKLRKKLGVKEGLTLQSEQHLRENRPLIYENAK